MKHSINTTLLPSNQDLKVIRIRVCFGGKRLDLLPSISYNQSKWNTETQRAKANTRNENRQSANEINKIINSVTEFIDDYFSSCELNNRIPDSIELRNLFINKFKHKKNISSKSIIDYYDEFVAESSIQKSWAQNTLKKYKTMRNMIIKMNIQEVSFDSLQQIVSSEIDEGKRNTTIAKNLRLIKVFGKWLKDKCIIDYDVESFNIRLKGSGCHHKAFVYLEFDELLCLLNYDFTNRPALGVIRDIFCFCAFSGLRYSDVKKLKKTDIKDDCINIITQKTSDKLQIELNKYTKMIINKYSVIRGDLLLPVISNQKTNKELKEACKIVGIDSNVTIVTFSGSTRIEINKPKFELISFHAARRTFVVECLRRGIPAEIIMKWTGHSTLSAMKPYMDIVDSLKKNAMKKFDD